MAKIARAFASSELDRGPTATGTVGLQRTGMERLLQPGGVAGFECRDARGGGLDVLLQI
jgi:hypothetical protein